MSRRSNPFEEIERLFERMSSGFEDSGMMGMQNISVDVADRDDALVVTADLPGYEKEDIDISAANRRLTISAERERDETAGDERFVRRERSHQRISRTVRLPEAIDEEAAEAVYRNGVLTVTLPKQSAGDDESHRIDID